jgi:phage shock protein A
METDAGTFARQATEHRQAAQERAQADATIAQLRASLIPLDKDIAQLSNDLQRLEVQHKNLDQQAMTDIRKVLEEHSALIDSFFEGTTPPEKPKP